MFNTDQSQDRMVSPSTFRYASKYEKKASEEYALRFIKREKIQMKEYREWNSVYPQYTATNPFHMHTHIPENETHFVYDWKMKLHDRIYYKNRRNRCKIGGLFIEPLNPYDPDSKMVISDVQPEILGLGYNEGAHWEDHSYHFTEQLHPASLDAFWTKLAPGTFPNEINLFFRTRDKVKKGREHELGVRKFFHYIKYWDIWCYKVDEYDFFSREYKEKQAAKAEGYLSLCEELGKPLPFPYYDQSKDEYWKYRTPNSLELLIDDLNAYSKRASDIYYKKASEFTEAEPYTCSVDLIEDLSGDDWLSQEVRERILATFPDLNKQIMDPNAPEYETRMDLVRRIIKMHPDYAPGHEGYDKEYLLNHPKQGVQEWAWRLGALMNAFGPTDPFMIQNITTRLSIIVCNSVMEHLSQNTDVKCINEDIYYDMYHLNTRTEKTVKNWSLTWYDTQYAAIHSLLHCDNVKNFYDSTFAVKTSSIMYSSLEDLDRYLKVMELNHEILHPNGYALFNKRDRIRLENLKKIQDAFLSYCSPKYLHTNDPIAEKENECLSGDYVLWNPLTYSFKVANKPIQRQMTTDAADENMNHLLEIAFRSKRVVFQQVGRFNQTRNRHFDKYFNENCGRFLHHMHFYLSHANVYLTNPLIYDMIALTRPENTNSITVAFGSIRDKKTEGCRWEKRALLTIDFNRYDDVVSDSILSDPDHIERMMPNADMDELLSWVPELMQRNISFTVSDTGLLTLYANDSTNPLMPYYKRGNTNLIEFLELHPEILIDHYFNSPVAYGMAHTFHDTETREEHPLVCDCAPYQVPNGSYKALRSVGYDGMFDPNYNGVNEVYPDFLELFNGYSYNHRPSLEEVRPAQKKALEALDKAKHRNGSLPADPVQIDPAYSIIKGVDKETDSKEIPEEADIASTASYCDQIPSVYGNPVNDSVNHEDPEDLDIEDR